MRLVFEFASMHTVPSQHLFVCLLPSVSISPLCIIVLSLPFLELIILCPFLPLSKKNDIYSSSPRCRVSSIHTSVFHLVPHWSTEEIRRKKVNIWTAAKDGRGVASLASAPVMSRPETSPQPEQGEMVPAISNNDRQRKWPYHFDVVYMATGLGMSAKDGCLPQQHLIHVSSRLKGEQRFEKCKSQ